MHFSRPTLGHPRGSAPSTSSGSSAASSANSATQPSPLALAVGQPSILEHPTEDEDDVAAPDAFPDGEPLDDDMDLGGGGSHIEIGDEQVDDNPFDPSLSDEWYIEDIVKRRAAANAAKGKTGGSPLRLLSKVLGSPPSSPRSQRPPSTLMSSSSSGNLSPGQSAPWRMNFRRRRTSSVDEPLHEADEEDDLSYDRSAGPSQGRGHDNKRRTIVQEPGILLSGTSPKKFGLLSLADAQGRSDIVRRPEGFEMNGGSRPAGM